MLKLIVKNLDMRFFIGVLKKIKKNFDFAETLKRFKPQILSEMTK